MEPILDTEYWKNRLLQAQGGHLHHAVFRCSKDRWERIEVAHRTILAELIGRGESILDAGCGWGRLLDLLPPNWKGRYLGVDLSPDFIALARRNYPHHKYDFKTGDLRSLPYLSSKEMDWGVLISIRPMVLRNLGYEVWEAMEVELSRVCKKLLFLEYDEVNYLSGIK